MSDWMLSNGLEDARAEERRHALEDVERDLPGYDELDTDADRRRCDDEEEEHDDRDC